MNLIHGHRYDCKGVEHRSYHHVSANALFDCSWISVFHHVSKTVRLKPDTTYFQEGTQSTLRPIFLCELCGLRVPSYVLQQIQHREQENPNQVDEVPVKTRVLD